MIDRDKELEMLVVDAVKAFISACGAICAFYAAHTPQPTSTLPAGGCINKERSKDTSGEYITKDKPQAPSKRGLRMGAKKKSKKLRKNLVQIETISIFAA